MSIQAIRLTNGDEIVGEISAETGTKTTIEKPARIIVMPAETGGVQIGLMPWTAYAKEDEFTLNNATIICIFEVTESLESEYRKNFGSGLDIPTHNIIH